MITIYGTDLNISLYLLWFICVLMNTWFTWNIDSAHPTSLSLAKNINPNQNGILSYHTRDKIDETHLKERTMQRGAVAVRESTGLGFGLA